MLPLFFAQFAIQISSQICGGRARSSFLVTCAPAKFGSCLGIIGTHGCGLQPANLRYDSFSNLSCETCLGFDSLCRMTYDASFYRGEGYDSPTVRVHAALDFGLDGDDVDVAVGLAEDAGVSVEIAACFAEDAGMLEGIGTVWPR